MTTEGGSEAEVKKEPEKSPEEQQEEQQSDPSESAPNAGTEPQPAPDNQENVEAEPAEAEPASPDPTSTPSPSGQKKEKGISRFLPPWLKRQKSHSQAEPKDSPAPSDTPTQPPTQEEVGTGQEEEGTRGEGTAVQSPGATQEVESREEEPEEEAVKAENSVIGTETQPVKEEKEGDLEEEVQQQEEQKGEEQADSAGVSPLKVGKKMKLVVCHVTLLDGSQFPCEVEKRAKGQYLFSKVCEHLNLLEKDYFGLSFKDNADQKCWLDPTKEIKRQIRNSQWQFAFNVKFYPPDPSQLMEDITRYLLCLQLRQDISSGRLPCSFVTHALLGSYTLQAELGDHDPDEHRLDYISDFQFAPTQTKELEVKVAELHKSHKGMTPAQADIQFLENAKKLSMYGVDLHHAKDSEGVDIMLGVCANGLLIYKDRLRINRFAWPKILKISYKRCNFYIKIRPGEAEQFESTVGFKLPNHRAAKRVWKVCVEHHTFFRLTSPEQPAKSKFLTLGSKFRYSGRTQAQTRQASALIHRPPPYFQRTSSKRSSRSLDGAPAVSVSDHAHLLDSAHTLGAGDNGRDSALELSSDSKSPQVEEGAEPGEGAASAVPAEPALETRNAGRDSAQIKDLDKTQEEVLKHQASISELKRSFMEAAPEPRANQWDKRLTGSPATSLRQLAQGSLEEELASLFLSKACFSVLADARSTAASPPESALSAVSEKSPTRLESALSDSRDLSKSTEDEQSSGLNGQLEVVEVVEETVVIEEVIKAARSKNSISEGPAADATATERAPEAKDERSASSDSESEEEAEYHPQLSVSTDSAHLIREDPEEEEQEVELNRDTTPTNQEQHPIREDVTAEPASAAVQREEQTVAQQHEEEESGDKVLVIPDKAPNGHSHDRETPPTLCTEEEEPCVVNGDTSHVDGERAPQVICCSEPPVVKTEMVTISDTFAAQKTEITTKEVPIVHTETKTITYEAAQQDGNGDGEPGVLMTAHTITSESLCTTTTTHITKTLKGGLSETRIEKRIVITGDSDIDHDEALAQAIKEAKEQHPDMSVTRVVVHKETELADEDE
ncbi:band 4.1-like protein 2 isoform X3 [Brachyhypopomus gauderio]|uniref:band 4.1-like protein 2 isoform X3 n=1 Tax=Brachyhypopomus gauderio TaxID=698409 RepID=UPI0040430F9E